MKANLRVISEDINDGVVTVKWHLGRRRYGTLLVDVSSEKITDEQDVRAIAELMGLRYLLWEVEGVIGDANPGSFGIMVSQPSILDVLAKQTDRHSIEPYASMLRTVYYKTEVKLIDAQELQYDGASCLEPVDVKITDDMRSPYMIVYIEGLGRLGISERCIKDFSEQHIIFSGGEPGNPFRSIYEALSHKHLALFSIPKRREQEKIEKYGPEGVAQVWRNVGGNMMYFILPKPDLNVLLTCIMGSRGYLSSQSFVRFRGQEPS